MTDSKTADTQAGYEKGYTIALAAQAGADMINLSVGMLGSIMVASPEMMVIDNEICGQSCAVSAVLMSGQASLIWMRWTCRHR